MILCVWFGVYYVVLGEYIRDNKLFTLTLYINVYIKNELRRYWTGYAFDGLYIRFEIGYGMILCFTM